MMSASSLVNTSEPPVSDVDHPAAGRTPLVASCALTFLCSIGTGVLWAGVPFIAKHEYGLGRDATLWLYLTLGVTYVLGALSTGRALRSIERRISPRRALAIILLIAAVASASLVISRAVWLLWIVAVVVNVVSSALWPIIESYVTAGRHSRDMRNALGIWNLTWTSAVLVSLIAISPLIEHHARLAMVFTAVPYVLGLAALRWFTRAPGAHGDAEVSEERKAAALREYPALLRSARMLLLSSYVMNSAMSPLLPFLIARLAVPADQATPLAAVWTASRFVTMAAMWRAAFWHGRWGALLLGGLTMSLGFGGVIISSSVLMLMVALAVIGCGMGIVYSAALYYAMSVGQAEVDAGGKHEAIIGLGYTIGPLASLAGTQVNASIGWEALGPDAGVVLAVLGVVFIAACVIARNYVGARRGFTTENAEND